MELTSSLIMVLQSPGKLQELFAVGVGKMFQWTRWCRLHICRKRDLSEEEVLQAVTAVENRQSFRELYVRAMG